MIATNWYKNSGNYKLLIEYAVGMDNIPGKKSDIEFFVTGDELEIRANIYFNTLDIDSTVNLSNFYIKRYYNSSDSVTIVSKWIPNPNKELLYVIKNNTKRIIYSVVWDRNFSGYIENNDNGQGKIYFRGKAIGIGNSYKQVFPGDSVDSYEPLFFDSKSFIVNKYVYEAYYSFAETLLGIPVNKSKNTMKGIFDYYLLRSEFEIKE